MSPCLAQFLEGGGKGTGRGGLAGGALWPGLAWPVLHHALFLGGALPPPLGESPSNVDLVMSVHVFTLNHTVVNRG